MSKEGAEKTGGGAAPWYMATLSEADLGKTAGLSLNFVPNLSN